MVAVGTAEHDAGQIAVSNNEWGVAKTVLKRHAPAVGGSSQGEGSILGGLGNLFGD